MIVAADSNGSPYVVLDAAFESLIEPDERVLCLADGCEWAEGPVWLPEEEAVVWSDIPNDRMLRWTEAGGVSLFRRPSNYANGNTLDREGRLVTCEHTAHRVSRTEADGSVVALIERFEGKRLNSPNDLVVKSDGSIWFTDPPYGILTEREGRVRDSEIGANWVYRLEPESGALSVVATDLDRPNGIAFSPDERRLYVSDSGKPRTIRVFDVVDGTSLAGGRVFFEMDAGVSDGFRVDTHGNVWTSAADGIHVITDGGVRLGKILVPEKVSNCAFGGFDGRTLFVTASTSLYSVRVRVRSAARPTP